MLAPVTRIFVQVISRGLFAERVAVFFHSLEGFVLTMSKRAGEDAGEQNDAKKTSPQLGDPLNMTKWIEENKSSFLPPVCNKMM